MLNADVRATFLPHDRTLLVSPGPLEEKERERERERNENARDSTLLTTFVLQGKGG